jgi:predicted nucleic acid-binding protein
MARPTKRTEAQASAPLILDSGAIIALSRGDQRARAFIDRALETGAELFVPSVAIAETVRGDGPRDAPVNRVLSAVDSVLLADEQASRTAGSLLGQTGSRETIDALVVAGVIEIGGGRIVTSDPDDLRLLARGASRVSVHRV